MKYCSAKDSNVSQLYNLDSKVNHIPGWLFACSVGYTKSKKLSNLELLKLYVIAAENNISLESCDDIKEYFNLVDCKDK